jgi:hypothetical protein
VEGPFIQYFTVMVSEFGVSFCFAETFHS